MNILNSILTTAKPLITSFILLDIKSGLTSAKDQVIDLVKFAVNNIGIPIIDTVLIGVLIFSIVGLIKLKRQGEDYSGKIAAVVVIVIVILLISTAPLWIWDLIA